MGIPAYSWRADQAGRDGRTVDCLGDPALFGYRSRTAAGWPDVAAVPARAGRPDPVRRFSSRRYRATEQAVCADIHRARHSPDAPGRRHRPPERWLDGATGRQPGDGPRRAVRGLPVLNPCRGLDFTSSFDAVFQATGTTILGTAVQAPRMNAIWKNASEDTDGSATPLLLAPVRSALVRVSARAGLALLTLADCAKMDAALSQRWPDVSFRPGTSVAQVLHPDTVRSHG